MSHNLFITFISFALSFIIAFTLYFPFRKLADSLGFYAIPNFRSSHRNHIPNIGGLMFYLSLPLTILLFWKALNISHLALLSILAVLSFLVIGLVDDKGSKSARQKFIFQVTGTGLFIAGEQLLLKNLFGAGSINFPWNFGITFLFILTVINAMNLIDGIDGLAAMLGLTSYTILGFLFYQEGSYIFSVFSFSMAGILLAYSYFNYSKKYKMIMGDTGSLWLGFSLSILIIKAVQLPAVTDLSDPGFQITPIAVLGLVSVPVFDLVRLFFLRIINRRSPFRADRNHIHHLLIDKVGLSHKQASFAIAGLNMIIFIVLYFAGSFFDPVLILVIMAVLFIFYNFLLNSVAGEHIVLLKRMKLNKAHQSK